MATATQIVFDCSDTDRLAGVHLDLNIGGGFGTPQDERRRRIDAEVDRILQLGARRSRTVPERGGYFVNLFDPEGNEFDVH